jgi:hypothetical protein
MKARASIVLLEQLAVSEFPDDADKIRAFVHELARTIELNAVPSDEDPQTLALLQAKETSQATGDDEVTLLYKLEDFLESLLIGRLAANLRR